MNQDKRRGRFAPAIPLLPVPRVNATKPARMAAMVSTVMVLAIFGFAGTAVADDKDAADELVNDVFGLGEEKTTKEHKTDKKVKYIALGGLGDVMISCPAINNIDTITVHDSTGGPRVAVIDFYAPGKEAPSGDVNIPLTTGVNAGVFRDQDPDLCIGGAIGFFPASTGNINWNVWISDAVWDTVEQVLKENVVEAVDAAWWTLPGPGKDDPTAPNQHWDLDIKVSGLARMVAEYDADFVGKNDTNSECPVDLESGGGDPTDLEICLQAGVGPTRYTGYFNQFGFCGQGYIEDQVNPWDEIPSGPGIVKTNQSVTKVVFLDGIWFYQFDCANEELAGTVDGIYDTVTSEVNDATCYGLDLVCFFSFPAVSSSCSHDKQQPNNLKHHNIGVPGILGTVGWSHRESDEKCPETSFSNWWWYTRSEKENQDQYALLFSYRPLVATGDMDVVVKGTPDPFPPGTVPPLVTIDFG